MQWFTRVASWAAVINVLVVSLGFYWPAVPTDPWRSIVISALIVALAVINILGIRQSAWVVNSLTVGKLLPLLLFIVVGGAVAAPMIGPASLRAGPAPPLAELSKSVLLLIFGLGGYEVVPIPAGESRNPLRDVPFALIMTRSWPPRARSADCSSLSGHARQRCVCAHRRSPDECLSRVSGCRWGRPFPSPPFCSRPPSCLAPPGRS
jgi:hypothetical protein